MDLMLYHRGEREGEYVNDRTWTELIFRGLCRLTETRRLGGEFPHGRSGGNTLFQAIPAFCRCPAWSSHHRDAV
jgi:hypothetical protein